MSKLYSGVRTGLVILSFTFFSRTSFGQPAIDFVEVLTGLSSPIDLVNAGDGTGRVFIVQQGGLIRVYNSSFGNGKNFLTVTGIVSGGEQGLLSLAFHPDYENPDPLIGGFFYVYYTNSAGDLELARYHVSAADPDLGDPSTKTVILTIPHPTFSNHNGGKLLFGNDGYLYFATGDGGDGGDPPNNAQRGDVLLGKMLRINVTNSASPPYYTIPPGNPYAGAGDPLDEIWAFGLRNPFRWSFDRLNQNMWIGDVGQGAREEVNYRAAGTTGGINYGWRCYEGNLPYNTAGCNPPASYIFPVYDYPNPVPGSAAVTGGVVYRGSAYPSLQGYYFCADVYSADVHIINATTFTSSIQSGLPGFIVCFGETENGEVYAVSLGGTIYQLQSAIPTPVTLVQFTARHQRGIIHLQWKTVFEQDADRFEIEYSRDGTQFMRAGTAAAANDVNGHQYSFDHPAPYTGRIFYRLKMIDLDASYEYSPVRVVELPSFAGNFIRPSLVHAGKVNIYLSESWEMLELIAADGSLVFQKNIRGQTGTFTILLPQRYSGVYVARLRQGVRTQEQKIVLLD